MAGQSMRQLSWLRCEGSGIFHSICFLLAVRSLMWLILTKGKIETLVDNI